MRRHEQLHVAGGAEAAGALLPACCSHLSRKCQDSVPDGYDLPPCEQQNMVTMLRWLTRAVLPGIEYYLSFGSLLGAVRHGGPMAYDTDVDLQLPANQWVEFEARLRAKTAEHHVHFVPMISDENPARLYFSCTNDLAIDLWYSHALPSSQLCSAHIHTYMPIYVHAYVHTLHTHKHACRRQGDPLLTVLAS